MAIDEAKAKAEKVASRLGVKLKKPVRFESYDAQAGGGYPRPMMARAAFASPEMSYDKVTDTATLGSQKITVTVNIAYGID